MANPAQVRQKIREQAQRKADAQALVDHFAQHHPALLAEQRLESLQAANKRGIEKHWTTEQTTADAWRNLIQGLRFLDPRKSGGAS